MTPDGYILWYYRTRDSFGAPALDYIDSVGRMFAKKCSCGSKLRHTTSIGDYVCGHCGKDWAYEDALLLKGVVKGATSSNSFDMKNARFFDVAKKIDTMLRQHEWDMKLYILNVLGQSQRDLSVRFPANFPDAPGPWSKDSVRRRIIAMRELFDRRLRAAGMNVSVY